MRFEKPYGGPPGSRPNQAEAMRWLEACERRFRRCVDRYEDEGPDVLSVQRPGQVSAGRAPVDKVVRSVRVPNTGGRSANVGLVPAHGLEPRT